MKTRLLPTLPILLAILLGGCQKPAAPEAADLAAGQQDQVTPAKPKTSKARAFKEALPAGIVLTLPYHARSVKTIQADDGKHFQRFTMEFLGMSVKEAEAALTYDMERAGFTVLSSKSRKGKKRIIYSRGDDGQVVAVISKENPDRLRHQDAHGFIRLRFPATMSSE